MASLAGMKGIPLPKFSENMPEEDAQAIRNYLFQLTDQLEYVLTNLGEDNMNEEFLKKAAPSAAQSA